MHVLDCTLTSENESALLAALDHGYEEQPESLTDALTSRNESAPRSRFRPLHFRTTIYASTI